MEPSPVRTIPVRPTLRDGSAAGLARAVRRAVRVGIRNARAVDRRKVTLEPAGTPRGNVLVAYLVDGFFTDRISRAHTQDWESVRIATTWAELGYRVDVISNFNTEYHPRRAYDVFVSTRIALESVGRRLDDGCLKILHIDTAHWLFHETAQHQRLLDIQRRRGVTLSRLRPVGRNHAIEFADCATLVGNEFTAGTYAYAKKPLYRVPISTPGEFPWPAAKDFDACRGHFIWFGSYAVVHKGLDLVLDAFAGMPEYRLTVVGRIDDPEFEAAYHKELHRTPTIEAVGWVDLSGPRFTEIADRCIGLVYPSCSEGGGGSAIACLHAGLIPIVSRESSVDVSDDFGVVLRTNTVDEIRRRVRGIARLPARQLERMAHRAWTFARERHTRERFADEYRRVAERIIATFRPSTPGTPRVAESVGSATATPARPS